MPFIEIDEPDFDAVYAALIGETVEVEMERASAESLAREAVADYMPWQYDTLDEAAVDLVRPNRWLVAERIAKWATLDMYDPHVGMTPVDCGHVYSAMLEWCRDHGIPV